MSMMKSDLQNFCESFSELDLPMGNDDGQGDMKTYFERMQELKPQYLVTDWKQCQAKKGETRQIKRGGEVNSLSVCIVNTG